MKKRYIVRKYINASSITEALRFEKTVAPDDIWIDDDWKKLQEEDKNMGFKK